MSCPLDLVFQPSLLCCWNLFGTHIQSPTWVTFPVAVVCKSLCLNTAINTSVKVPSIYHWFSTQGCSRVCLDPYHACHMGTKGSWECKLNSLLPLCFIRGPHIPRRKHGQCPSDSELSPNLVQEEGQDVHIAPCFPIPTSSNNSLGAFISISCHSEYSYISTSFSKEHLHLPFHLVSFAKWLLCKR